MLVVALVSSAFSCFTWAFIISAALACSHATLGVWSRKFLEITALYAKRLCAILFASDLTVCYKEVGPS